MTHTLAIRAFIPSDAAVVSQLICRCLVETNIKDYSEPQIQKMLPGFAPDCLVERFSGDDVFVAEGPSGVVGVGRLHGNELGTMFVSPDHHGHGVGRAIINYLENLAAARDIEELVVFSSITAREFYAKLGYLVGEASEHPIAGTRFKCTKRLPTYRRVSDRLE